MGLDSFKPLSTQKAGSTAVSAFFRFLEAEGVSMKLVRAKISADPTGARLTAVMDSFGVYLASHEGKSGKSLSQNSAVAYYRQVKMWMLQNYPALRPLTELDPSKQARTLEGHCKKERMVALLTKLHHARKKICVCYCVVYLVALKHLATIKMLRFCASCGIALAEHPIWRSCRSRTCPCLQAMFSSFDCNG